METGEFEKVLNAICHSSYKEFDDFTGMMEKLRSILQGCKDNEDYLRAEFIIFELEKGLNSEFIQNYISEFAFSISTHYRKIKIFVKAVSFGKISVKSSKKFKFFSENTAMCLLNLAYIHAAMDNHNQAIRKLNKSFKILRKVIETNPTHQSKNMLSFVYFNLAAEEENLHNFEKAQKKYIEALDYIKQTFESPNSQLVNKISASIERVGKLISSQDVDSIYSKQESLIYKGTNNPQKSLQTAELRNIKSKETLKSAETKPKIIFKSEFSNKSKNLQINSKTLAVSVEEPDESLMTSSHEESQKDWAKLHMPSFLNQLEKNKNSSILSINQRKSEETKNLPIEKLSIDSSPSKLISGDKDLKPINSFKAEISPLKSTSITLTQTLNRNSILENEKKSLFSSLGHKKSIIQPTAKKPAFIFSSKLEIDLIDFNVAYSFKSNLTVVEILCQNSQSSYTLEVPFAQSTSVFDFIKTKIEPCLSLKNDSLILEKSKKIMLSKGLFINDQNKCKISITQFYPRWKIQVNINEKSQVFEMVDIKNNFPGTAEFIKDSNFLLTLFMFTSKGVQVNLAINYPLEKVFEGTAENEYLKLPLEIIVSRVNYATSSAFLVQSKETTVFPLIIDNQLVCKRCDRVKPTLKETLSLILNFIGCDESSQIVLMEKVEVVKITETEKKSKKNVKISNEPEKMRLKSRMKTSKTLPENLENFPKYKSLSNTNTPTSNDKEENNLEKRVEDYNKVMIQSKPADQIDYKDNIILRTCLYRNNRIYQIYMSQSEDDCLNFYIRKGSETENLSKLSIDICTLCIKTGLNRNYLIPLGSYVLRNMLTIKESDICYFDFTRLAYSPMKAIDKITGLLKGFFIRKKINLKLKNLVLKRKIKVDALVYTCLIYLGPDLIYLRLVKSWEVLSLDLNLKEIVKDGYMVTIDKFFTSLISLGLKIIDKNNIRSIAGLEKYRIN